MDYQRKRNDEIQQDYPPHSRLFVVCGKVPEDLLRQEFSRFGTIEDIKMPQDHNTGEPKGIAYIKFSKTSEAAKALEALNIRNIGDSTRPLKVMVAANRSDIQNDEYDEGRYKRLFIIISKTETEQTLEEHFRRFGDIETIIIQRDRDTGDNRGGAYVKFRKFSEAANAYEQCDRKYRAVFAKPKGYNKRSHETSFQSNINDLADNTNISLISIMKTQPRGYAKVHVMCSPYLTKFDIERIFDLVPGMTHCQYMVDLVRNFGRGTITYSNPTSAAYAVDKIGRFEYPPGCKLFVKPDSSNFNFQEQYFNVPQTFNKLRGAINNTQKSQTPDLAQLAEAIAEASKVLKMATGVAGPDVPDSNDLSYCSVRLPPPKPLAHIDSQVAKRCFLVCKPQPPPLTVLRDIFCRFGDLINVYTLPNKTVGYARYASVEAANAAIKTLHGAEVCGVRMKVLEAEDEAPPKRARYENR